MAKPEIRLEEMKMFSQWTAIMTKVKPQTDKKLKLIREN